MNLQETTDMTLTTIVENLKTLTLSQTTALISQIEMTFGVTTLLEPPRQSLESSSLQPQPKEMLQKVEPDEPSGYQVILGEVQPDKKIAVLKVVRSVTGLGLKESKDIVDNLPKVVIEVPKRDQAEAIQKELETAGGKTEIKPVK